MCCVNRRTIMLTIEYRVNGQLIGFTNLRNTAQPTEDSDLTFIYEYEHRPNDVRKVDSGIVTHKQKDGFEVLVHKVLGKITKQI